MAEVDSENGRETRMSDNEKLAPSNFEEEFRVWEKYESVAMHFNDLLMRWRLQAVGGLGALVAVAGTVVKDLQGSPRYWAVLLFAGTFGFLWTGVACVDLFYYRRLLTGAVKALLDLEKNGQIQLSTKIETEAHLGGRITPFVFYALGFAPLGLIIMYAFWRLGCGCVSH